MSLRDALKADFGVDVLVNGGSGRCNDPFIILPCSAAEAVRTQLVLLRGLGRGRGELWRLVQAEPVAGFAPAQQRLRIETVAFTHNEIISETRTYYFDVSRVDGTPNAQARVTAWADPRTSFAAPAQIGWLHFDAVIDNGQDTSAFDVSLFYSGLGAKAAIYIYGFHDPLQHVSSEERRANELQRVCNQVFGSHPDAKMPWPIREVGPFTLQHFLIGKDLSVAGVAINGSHYLKLRLTYFDDPKMRELMSITVDELARVS